MQLPYYGVFDFLSFSYEKGTVGLYGYAYHPGLKSDAERAVKRASRVDQVVNKIEDLPPSSLDDDLRWQVYYAIYRDPFLSRYAPGGAHAVGPSSRYSGPFGRLGPSRFPGTEPAGDFPIHIIVKGLRVTLLGVVDNEGDKNLAGMKARGVLRRARPRERTDGRKLEVTRPVSLASEAADSEDVGEDQGERRSQHRRQRAHLRLRQQRPDRQDRGGDKRMRHKSVYIACNSSPSNSDRVAKFGVVCSVLEYLLPGASHRCLRLPSHVGPVPL